MINYSIVMRGNPTDKTVAKKAYASAQYSEVMDINRFAEEHALMVVNNQTDSATPFNLDKKGSKIKLLKKDNEIIIEETPRTF